MFYEFKEQNYALIKSSSRESAINYYKLVVAYTDDELECELVDGTDAIRKTLKIISKQHNNVKEMTESVILLADQLKSGYSELLLVSDKPIEVNFNE